MGSTSQAPLANEFVCFPCVAGASHFSSQKVAVFFELVHPFWMVFKGTPKGIPRSLGPPVVPFYQLVLGRVPYYRRQTKKLVTLTSLLEDLGANLGIPRSTPGSVKILSSMAGKLSSVGSLFKRADPCLLAPGVPGASF